MTNTNQFAQMRRAMVDSQLRPSDVTDAPIVAVFDRVPRERFVAPAHHAVAYMDRRLPLDSFAGAQGRVLQQPLVTGLMIAAAGVRPGMRLLVVGAATGYLAALLGEMGAEVTALEQVKSLAKHAKTALAPWPRVAVVEGALEKGTSKGKPFDCIIIDGAVETIPASFTKLLSDGGYVVTALADAGVTRLARAYPVGDAWSFVPFADRDVTPLPGFAKAKAFVF